MVDGEIFSTTGNLEIGTLTLEEFADGLDDQGVYRSF
jgi:hypothetical protein